MQPVSLTKKTSPLADSSVVLPRKLGGLGSFNGQIGNKQAADASTSPLKDRDTPTGPGRLNNKSPMPGILQSHENTISEEPNLDSGASTTLQASVEKLKEVLEEGSKVSQKQVKVRLFDIGGINDFVKLPLSQKPSQQTTIAASNIHNQSRVDANLTVVSNNIEESSTAVKTLLNSKGMTDKLSKLGSAELASEANLNAKDKLRLG